MSTDFLPARSGAGPLLQRDYWAVFSDGAPNPIAMMAHVKTHFCSLAPAALVTFSAPDGLRLNATLDIVITPGQRVAVRVLHESPNSVTLATLEGHPEAGRITFGCYRNAAGAVIFHIRSRARSATTLKRIGFLAIGDAMQTNTWTDFIRNTAAAVNTTIEGVIHADTEEVEERSDDGPLQGPTFLAIGD